MIYSTALKPLAAAALALCASGAMAYVSIGSTSGSPTYNRADADFGQLSGVGTDVAYDTFSFSVDTAGTYGFRSFAFQGWDNYLFLYSSFSADSPLDNGLIANDDFNQIGRSGFSYDLTTGVSYTLVTTGYSNDAEGLYLTWIRGPGEVISPVPEPETYALLLAGLAALGLWTTARRRSN